MNRKATEYDITGKNASFAPETCHEHLLRNSPRSLTLSPQKDFKQWRRELDARLRELLGSMPEPSPLNVRVAYEKDRGKFIERRFAFSPEPNADAPCHLLIPKTGSPPYPVVICLQGHTTGMHISLGRAKHWKDYRALRGDRDFALQAVRQGFAALAIEQRCFGERKDRRPGREIKSDCQHAAMTALLLGRTMIGERVWDLSRAIDALATFPEIDTGKIGVVGQSAGGTIAYYGACLDERISITMPSCVVCTYEDSLARIDHCVDNYLPRALQFFEMGDLAGLIAPRPLIVVAGRRDGIFPFHGVEKAFARIQEIYTAAGAADRCNLIVGEGGHRFYAGLAWPAFRRMAGW
jgi:dienelactone hydrolase